MTATGDARIEYQGRIEAKVRTQLVQLLTPLLGAGNFSTEVQAEVDLNETSATRETFDKNGSALRVEQGQWTGNQKDGGQPGGIPGYAEQHRAGQCHRGRAGHQSGPGRGARARHRHEAVRPVQPRL